MSRYSLKTFVPLLLLLFVFACQKNDNSFAPKSISNTTLILYYNVGVGAYKNDKDTSRLLQFHENNKFTVESKSKTFDYSGTYEYKRLTPDRARAILFIATGDNAGESAGDKVIINLYYSSRKQGVFDGEEVSREKGSFAGHFRSEKAEKIN